MFQDVSTEQSKIACLFACPLFCAYLLQAPSLPTLVAADCLCPLGIAEVVCCRCWAPPDLPAEHVDHALPAVQVEHALPAVLFRLVACRVSDVTKPAQ